MPDLSDVRLMAAAVFLCGLAVIAGIIATPGIVIDQIPLGPSAAIAGGGLFATVLGVFMSLALWVLDEPKQQTEPEWEMY
jgi:hypothetical protein